ncbi:MAG TPA: FAD-dependent oxidoreductase [Pyrinomonadaceae bacterium]|nr:FAD-dependent oxidoreductase [Pyrinomonadaceae bacterium]
MESETTGAKRFDVIVVGGGPAGAAAATHLAAAGARVLVVEREHFPREKLCGEFISPECFGHFARLGVAGEIDAAGGVRVGETKFFAASGRAAAVPSEWFGDGGGESCALGLSRAEMDARLLTRAREAGASVWEGVRAAGVVWDGGRVAGVRVVGEDGERVCRARVVIDATGRARFLAQGADKLARGDGRASGGRRARLVAFKAHLEGARGAGGACEIYFYRGGYGGLSGVEGGRSNLCFIAAAEDVRARGSDPERVVREVLMTNRRAAETLRDARAVGGGWLAVALERFGRFSPAPAAGLLCVGDAASFIDPFTGSGMLMALESGELAAESVASHLPRLREGGGGAAFGALAEDYGARYREKFGARLRVCSALRRAAFAPAWATEAGVLALGASAGARRALARATRGTKKGKG